MPVARDEVTEDGELTGDELTSISEDTDHTYAATEICSDVHDFVCPGERQTRLAEWLRVLRLDRDDFSENLSCGFTTSRQNRTCALLYRPPAS